MKDILVSDVVRICKGNLLFGKEGDICRVFCKDTREVKDGDVYVGIKGENFDGNLLYKEAFEKGAKIAILQNVGVTDEDIKKYENDGKSIVIVDDTVIALGQIAKYKRSLYNIPVVAITGSVGKTSTKDIIASVVSKKYKVLKTEGNLNNHIGLPLTLLKLKDHEAVVVEMGMNHTGEISYLTNIAKPTIAVITNIGTSHIGNLGSRENILKAKLEILEGLDEGKEVIINNDNDLLHTINSEKYKLIKYGIEEESELMPYNIEIKDIYSTYNIKIKNKEYNVKVPISGKHFIYNSLSAFAVGLSLDIKIEDIIHGIEDFELTKKRMDIQVLKNKDISYTVINDSYNASYDSMKASFEYLKEVKGNRKIAVLGNMLELGNFSEELHKKVGKEVYKNDVDVLVTVGDLAKNISKQAIEKGFSIENIKEFENNTDVIEFLKNIVIDGDIILLKASNSMNFTSILEGLNKGE